jgi:hypothetical protein
MSKEDILHGAEASTQAPSPSMNLQDKTSGK